MKTRLTANLSILSTGLLLLLSFSFGFNKYTEARHAIVQDLNQALQRTIMQNSELWINQDTLKTYSRLSALYGNPVSIGSYNKEFAEALSFQQIKDETGIIIQIKNKEKEYRASLSPVNSKELADNHLASDTILWMSANIHTTDKSASEEIGISFQGYANCSTAAIISITDKTWPGIFLTLAILSGCTSLLLKRKRETEREKENTVSYGNLTLACDKVCFYKENQDKLKLTPQQFTLMEMFFSSPTRMLIRTDICEALWPGKTNADETLNTLIRRLRPLIEENSNLKITTDRGRAYVLEIRADVKEELSD